MPSTDGLGPVSVAAIVNPLQQANPGQNHPDGDLGLSKQQLKSKIIVHRRINKTFAVNTPEQSCDKQAKAAPQGAPKGIGLSGMAFGGVPTAAGQIPRPSAGAAGQKPVVRQRDKIPQSRGESPLMNDLNWYLMNKDHDFIGGPSAGPSGPVIGKQHLIGVNPPPGGAA